MLCGDDGGIVRTLMLPKGKKPLVFSFDDVTYDSRKRGTGMVDKLIVDEDGYVCTYTEKADGSTVVAYDNEIFPVVDEYVRCHPDFTFHGARGTLFLTGFDGILGYRTQSEPVDAAEAALRLDREAEIREASKVVAAMKAEGWTFGSHSCDHRHMTRLSADEFKNDIDTWLGEVGSIVGETQLFLLALRRPHRRTLRCRSSPRRAAQVSLRQRLSHILGCGSARYIAGEPDGLGVFTDRKGMTGDVLYYIEMGYEQYRRDYLYLIDPDAMWDPLRLPYKYMPPYKTR